jgi:ABC-type Zn uptake system ZnuABC Zn-binding protein ZnuA
MIDEHQWYTMPYDSHHISFADALMYVGAQMAKGDVTEDPIISNLDTLQEFKISEVTEVIFPTGNEPGNEENRATVQEIIRTCNGCERENCYCQDVDEMGAYMGENR